MNYSTVMEDGGVVLAAWNESAATPTTPSGSSTRPGGPLDAAKFNWSFISVLVFVVAGTVGNALVCLAVWLERPLQNVTNWFLVSLAFADLIVSTIVMPFGATAGFLGTRFEFKRKARHFSKSPLPKNETMSLTLLSLNI